MPTHSAQGFRSLFVLHKLGFDLRGSLADTVEAPLPAHFVRAAEAIPSRDGDHDVIVLHASEYRAVPFDNLA